jgi:hypothetical protein
MRRTTKDGLAPDVLPGSIPARLMALMAGRPSLFFAVALAGAGTSAAAEARAADDPHDPYEPQTVHYEERTPGWFYLDTDVGLESINLQTFKANAEQLTAAVIPSSGFGPTVSVGAGFRLVFLTAGLRARMAAFQDSSVERTVGSWQQWSFDGELGFRVPLGYFEPHLLFNAGYTTFGGFNDALSGLGRGIDVNGADIRGVIGFDYFLGQHVSFGVNLGGALLALSRKGVSIRDLAMAKEVATLNEAKARILEGNGSSLGTAVTVTGAVGLHF